DPSPRPVSSRIQLRRTQERRHRFLKAAALVSILAVALVVMFAFLPDTSRGWTGWGWLSRKPANAPVADGPAVGFPADSCPCAPPDVPWEQDLGDVRDRLRALLVMRRSDPEAWLAVLARDYRRRTPRDDEVRDDLLRRLQEHFTEHLQSE